MILTLAFVIMSQLLNCPICVRFRFDLSLFEISCHLLVLADYMLGNRVLNPEELSDIFHCNAYGVTHLNQLRPLAIGHWDITSLTS